ncbi:18957_t:CDS:2 [Entrophospora sp. SA101]|nr:18957_t:CDS:2 [Entrophospora sp. SA101]
MALSRFVSKSVLEVLSLTPDEYRKRKVALLTGITGQDGSYLTEFLLDKGYIDKLKERITKAKEYRVYNSHKGYTNLVKRTDAQLEELSKYEGGTFLSYILVILETCVFSFVR